MNTAEFDKRLRHLSRPERTEPRLHAVQPVGVTVLSADPELCEAIRAAAENHYPLSTATTLEEAQQLAASGKCGILVTDQALSQNALVQIGKQMRAHDPATITIAVGSRGDDNALIGLLSSAVVERFMLKPVTPSLARLVLRSAAGEYHSLKYRTRRESQATAPVVEEPVPAEPVVVSMPITRPVPMSVTQARAVSAPAEPAHPEPELVPAPVFGEPYATPIADAAPPASRGMNQQIWWIAAAAALVVGVAVWWAMRAQIPQIDPRQVIATNLAAASQAMAQGHYVDPPESSALHFYSVALSLDAANADARRGMEQITNRMIEDVKLAIAEGRLAEAGIALERVRRISPDNRLALLDTELRTQQASQISRLQSPVTAAAEAVPVVQQTKPASVAGTSKRRTPAAPAPVEHVAKASVPLVAAVPMSQTVSSSAQEMGPPAPVAGKAGEAASIERTPAAVAVPVATPSSPPSASGSTEPRLVRMVEPEFPKDARSRGIEGWVDLTVNVDIWGQVTDARVTSAENGRFFERAAVASVKKWRYEPRPYADPSSTEPVKVRVKFKLQD